MRCPNCARKVMSYHNFCHWCGEPLKGRAGKLYSAYEKFEVQIPKLWGSRGMEVLKQRVEGLGSGKFKWTIIAKERE